MRGPFYAALIASTVLMSAGPSGVAYAQKKKVVVEMFKGPANDLYRNAVIKALGRAGVDVIPDKRLAGVEADLGLQHVSDNYVAVAKELKLNGFVAGTIIGGKRPKAHIVVRNPDGKAMGQQIWQANGAPKLMGIVSSISGTRVAAILNGGGGGAELPAEPAVAADEPEEKPAKGGKAAKSEEEAAPAAEEEAVAEAPKKKKKKSAAKDDATSEDAAVEASADEEEEAPRSKRGADSTGLKVEAVLRLFSRNFAYNQSIQGGQQGYQAPEQKFNNLPLVPAPGFALEYFPTSYVGVNASYNKGIAGSKDAEGSIYKTNSYFWELGAKGRIPVSSFQLEPAITYGALAFEIDNFVSDPTRIQVAGVNYKTVQVGGGIRFPFSSGGAFTVGAHYDVILSAGDILDEMKYFKGSALGGDGFADLTLPLSVVKGLELHVGGQFRRIVFAFSNPDTPPAADSGARIAGGAVDRYIWVNLGLSYHFDL